MLNIFNMKYVLVIMFILTVIAFWPHCHELDANCDGEINITDMSIFLAKAEMVTHETQ